MKLVVMAGVIVNWFYQIIIALAIFGACGFKFERC